MAMLHKINSKARSQDDTGFGAMAVEAPHGPHGHHWIPRSQVVVGLSGCREVTLLARANPAVVA